MKLGSPVLYVEGGKEYIALVVGSRSLEHHHGANDEPLLNLAFVKEVLDGTGQVRKVTGTVREAEQIQFRHDIAHASHAFSDEAREALTKQGTMYPGGEIPGGRWKQVFVGQPKPQTSAKPAAPAAQGDGKDSGSDKIQ